MNSFNLEGDKKNILIFGASGRLGKKVINELRENIGVKFQIFTTSRDKKKSDFIFNIDDIENLKKIIIKTNPYAIINCIAYTDVDDCEINQEDAYKTNAIFPENIIKTIDSLNLKPKVIHISTDQIYESNSWSVIGQEKPLNIYSKSKFLGDQNILRYEKSIILRTNFLWNENNDGPVHWLKNKCKSNEEFVLFNDVFYNPVEIKFLSSLIHKIIFKEKYGIYNIGSSTSLSKADVFYKIAKILKLDLSNARFDSINSIRFKAKRPKNMTISVKKFEEDFNIKLPSMNKTLNLLLKK